MATAQSDDKRPTPDPAEDNAFFPSPYSLSQFTAPKSDLSGADYPAPYKGGRWKVLVVGADERYLMTDKFEFWAMPSEDEEVKGLFSKYRDQFKQPLKLADVVEEALGEDSDYIGVFIPGGHGALIGLPESEDMKAVLEWAVANDKFMISLCHGPAAFLAAEGRASFAGYKICAFPDALDAQTPDMGYMPGHLTWKFGEKLKAMGFEIVNDNISGETCQDRKMLTGDSPLAGNSLGKLAATALLEAVGNE